MGWIMSQSVKELTREYLPMSIVLSIFYTYNPNNFKIDAGDDCEARNCISTRNFGCQGTGVLAKMMNRRSRKRFASLYFFV